MAGQKGLRIAAVSFLVICAILAGCGSSPEPVQVVVTKVVVVTPTPTPKRDVIIVGLVESILTLDPADYRDRETETVLRNMFDGLVTRDTRSGVHLELAQSLEWLDDLTLEVRLRQGVKFHDGVEMTADDVVFTFERIISEDGIEYPEPHTSARKGLIAQLESVEKVDDYTVVMHFSDPWPAAMQMLVHQQIVPQHYLEEVGTEGFIAHPIGTGPFSFVSAQGFDEIVMERFDDYWGGAPDLEPVGPACVGKAIFRAISESSTRVAALLAGEVDVIQALPAELADTLEQTPGIQVKSAPSTQPKWMEMNVHQPPFDDVRVRQALNYAVDKDLIIDSIYGGRAVPLTGPLSPYNNYVNKDMEPYPHDPGKALELLARAGWSDSDGDGTLDRDGRPLAFTIDTLELFRPLAEAVAVQLQTVGIDADVRVWEYSVVRPMLLAGERMAYLDDWGDSAFDPYGHFEAKWHSYQEGSVYGRGNFSTYSNERVNELIRQGERKADPAKRQIIYDEAQQIVYAEAPALFLILPEETEAARKDILGWEPASDSRINLHDVCIEGPSS